MDEMNIYHMINPVDEREQYDDDDVLEHEQYDDDDVLEHEQHDDDDVAEQEQYDESDEDDYPVIHFGNNEYYDDEEQEEVERDDEYNNNYRVIHFGINRYNDNDDDDDDDDDDEDQELELYNTEVTTQHSYLGVAETLSGRTIFDEDLIQEVNLISHPSIILMPGQTLPMSFSHPVVISMLKRVIETTKTFGIVNKTESGIDAKIGTTAEIYEFRDPSPYSSEIVLKIKARGSQRFKILSTRRQVDGNNMAVIQILPEITMPPLFHDLRLRSRDRFFQYKSEQDRQPLVLDNGHHSAMTQCFSRLLFSSKLEDHENKEEFLLPTSTSYKNTPYNVWRSRKLRPTIGIWPSWVYEMYDENILVERIYECLKSLRLFSQTEVTVPNEPSRLSFWIATNLPLDDVQKQNILNMNSSFERLRYEVKILEKSQTIGCKSCGAEIALHKDIFSMSKEGPQGAYVNAGGFVHETLTVYKTTNVNLVGSPSTNYTWFPGYAWIIARCCRCGSHIGWKYLSKERKLRPRKFYGISRRMVRSQLNLDMQGRDLQ